MKSAAEILKSTMEKYNQQVQPLHKFHLNSREITLFSEMLNEARKEAIEECAERAESEWIRYGTNMGHAVDKDSILSLIKELQ